MCHYSYSTFDGPIIGKQHENFTLVYFIEASSKIIIHTLQTTLHSYPWLSLFGIIFVEVPLWNFTIILDHTTVIT